MSKAITTLTWPFRAVLILILSLLCALVSSAACRESHAPEWDHPVETERPGVPVPISSADIPVTMPLQNVAVTGVTWAGAGDAPELHGIVTVTGSSTQVVWSAVRGGVPDVAAVSLEGEDLVVAGRIFIAGENYWDDVEVRGDYAFEASGNGQAVVLCLGDDCLVEVHLDVQARDSCPAGWELVDGACEFSQVIQGSGFDDASAWQSGPFSHVNENGVGDTDPGVAVISSDAFCLGDMVSQDVELPDGPLVAETRFRSTGFGAKGAIFASGTLAGELTAGIPWQTMRTCLGDSARGATTLSVGGTYHPGTCYLPAVGIEFDYLHMVEPTDDDRCPAVGEFSGSLDSPDGWLVTTNDSPVPPLVEFGDDGLVVETYGPCIGATIRGRVSVPLGDTLPNPALVVDISGDHQTFVHTWLSMSWSQWWEPGDPPVTICLGDVAGAVPEVSIRMRQNGGACSLGDTLRTVVSDIQLVSRPELCP